MEPDGDFLTGRINDVDQSDNEGGRYIDGVWKEIPIAPFDRDLQLAVIEGDEVHALVFACRRSSKGWVKSETQEIVVVRPTHWREWQESRLGLA